MKAPRVGTKVVFRPVGMDIWDNRTELVGGETVQVIQPFGCPKNGTMGHCYVGDKNSGKFIGLVLVNSLQRG